LKVKHCASSVTVFGFAQQQPILFLFPNFKMQNLDDLVDQFAPSIWFHGSETSFPISAEHYFRETDVYHNGAIVQRSPTFQWIYDHRQEAGLSLQFRDLDWKEKLAGGPGRTVAYVRVIRQPESFLFVYFYLFSHTEPYQCCDCCFCPCISKFAHKADLKYIGVEVKEEKISRVYFGAHGSNSGVWRSASQLAMDGTHPMAWSARGDHSFYPAAGTYPRIFGVLYDHCEAGFLSRPQVVPAFANDAPEFDAETDGWVYFPGKMNTDGIDPPTKQGFWNGEFPATSNNWFRRLFVPTYW
jgi:hypothetical protein